MGVQKITNLWSGCDAMHAMTTKRDQQQARANGVHSAEAPELPKRPRLLNDEDKMAKSPKLCPAYKNEDFVEQFRTAFMRKENVCDEATGAAIDSHPFTCCHLPNFVDNPQFLDSLNEDLSDEIFCEKNNDLYKFHQSSDLKLCSASRVKAFRDLLTTEFLPWLKEVTGISLYDSIDLTCSRYEDTDTLLCHDDELEGRRIAFIFYLVSPTWCEKDGGSLDLFDTDELGQPRDITRSITPQRNCLVFFEVSPVSFHQVREVLTTDKCRVSVAGWFHGPTLPRPAPYCSPQPAFQLPGMVEEALVYSWVNPQYLEEKIQRRIRQQFHDDSEIQLHNFFQDSKSEDLLKALRSLEAGCWKERGPPNKRKVELLSFGDDDALPAAVRECVRLLRSEAIFLILSSLTGIALHPLHDSGTSGDEADEVTGRGIEDGTPRDISQDVSSDNSDYESDIGTTTTAEESCSLSSTLTNISGDGGGSGERPVTARCRVDVRQWRTGCYTLLHDSPQCSQPFALDAQLFLGCEGWKEDMGGFTAYVAKGEDDELLSLEPRENSLALVYRDENTQKFVKHVNHRLTTPFYDICASYLE